MGWCYDPKQKAEMEQWDKEIVYRLSKGDVVRAMIAHPALLNWKLVKILEFADTVIIPNMDMIRDDVEIRRIVTYWIENTEDETWADADEKYAVKLDKARDKRA